MRLGTNKTVENFEEIDSTQIENAENPWKQDAGSITTLSHMRTLNVGVGYAHSGSTHTCS